MLYLTTFVLVPLFLGCLLLFWTFYMIKNKKIAAGLKQQALRDQLTAWQINENMSSQTLDDVDNFMSRLMGFMILGGGIGMIVYGLVMAGIALVTSHTLLVGNSMRGEPFVEAMLLFFFVGSWLGDIAGFRSLKRKSIQRVAFGDLRRRLASDYRSPLFHVIPVLLCIINITVALICMSVLHSPIRILFMNDTVAWWPSWILLILPALMPLLIVATEAVVQRIVRFSRLLVTAQPELAYRIDNMLRAIIIGALIGGEYSMIGNLQMSQFRLLVTAGQTSSTGSLLPEYITRWLLLSFLISLALIIIGMVFGLLRGHLGGTVSGWPKRHRNEGPDGAAVTDY